MTFEKPCARRQCAGLVRHHAPAVFRRRKFCSRRCAALVSNERRLAAMPPERAQYVVGYRRGYKSGYHSADYRWRQWLKQHPVNQWFPVKGPTHERSDLRA